MTHEIKKKPGRPKGAKNKSTLIAEGLTKAGIVRTGVSISSKRFRLAENRLNDLLRDRTLTVNQVLFASQLIAILNGFEIPLGLTIWEKRTIRALVEDRELLQRLKRTALESTEPTEAKSDAEKEQAQRTEQALAYLKENS
jgi:hypothetical protein